MHVARFNTITQWEFVYTVVATVLSGANVRTEEYKVSYDQGGYGVSYSR